MEQELRKRFLDLNPEKIFSVINKYILPLIQNDNSSVVVIGGVPPKENDWKITKDVVNEEN